MKTESLSVSTCSDTPPYLALARELLSTGSFTKDHITEIFRTPAYPVFLMPGLLLGHVELVTMLLQIVLSALTVYLVFKTAYVIFEDETTARAASVLYAFEPLSIVYSLILLTETLFTFTLMVFIFFTVKLLKSHTIRYAVASGISSALCSYIRPVALYLPILTAVFLIIYMFFMKPKSEKKTLFMHLAVFLLISLSLTGLWQLRNFRETGYSKFSSVSEFNLYFYHRVSIMAHNENLPFYQVQDSEEKRFKVLVKEKNLSYAGSFVYMQREALKVIKENLDIFVPTYIKGIVTVLLSTGATEYAQLLSYKGKSSIFSGTLDSSIFQVFKEALLKTPLLLTANVCFGLLLLLYYFLMTIGALNMKKSDAHCIFLLLVLTYFILLSGGVTGYGRFRHPVMPIISILGGYGVVFILTRIKTLQLK